MESNISWNDSRSFAPPTSLLSQKIELYGFLGIMPFGIILNTATFVVFYIMKSHRTSTGLHLMATAAVDNCLLVGLYFSGPGQRSDHINIPNIAGMNIILCRFFHFLMGFGFVQSAILLASVTIERYVSIAYPLKVKSWNLLRVSKVLILGYLIISIVWCVAYVHVVEISHYKDVSFCTQRPGLMNLLVTVISSVVTNLLCSSLILSFTVLMACSLFKIRNKRNNLIQNNRSFAERRNEYKITFMVFMVAVLFILFRFPSIVVTQWIPFYPTPIDENDQTYIDLLLSASICNILVVINHSVNFVIYITFMRSFRATCFKLIYRNRNKRQGRHQDISTVELRDSHMSQNLTSA